MQVLDVPVFNDDGSVKFTQLVSPDEAQVLLQFAINFLLSTGITVKMLQSRKNDDDAPEPKTVKEKPILND
jgi:hypothetical protein